MNQHLSLSSSVILTPRRAGLREGGEYIVDVLVRVQAPDAPAGLVFAADADLSHARATA